MIVQPPNKQPTELPTADIHGMRAHNAAIVVRRLWETPEGLSRAVLARELGLSRSTISAIVEGLLASGLAVESHLAETAGGRRPMVLRFHDDHRHVLGIDLGASHITVVRTDLRCRALARVSETFDVQHDPAGTLARLSDLIGRVLAPSGPPLLGIAVGVPCPVDAAATDQLSPRIMPDWKGVRLADWLHDRYGYRVFLDNDANLGALAEGWWGAGRGTDHFAYIKVGTGVGSGYLIDRDAYRGASGIAGEIGHTAVQVGGRLCRCGLSGCLEAEVGSPALLAKVRDALSAGERSSLAGAPQLDLGTLIAHAHAGDPLATRIIADAGSHLGVAVANLLNLLNPGKVVLGGRLSLAGELLLAPLRQVVASRAFSVSLERANIALGELGRDHVALGGATLVVQQALANPQLFAPQRIVPYGVFGRFSHVPVPRGGPHVPHPDLEPRHRPGAHRLRR
jgi:predicted NBD/HSP70 family sugar kinase